ncbi:Oleate hydratase [Methanimicrococcus hongohii]|uniref:Oleate hydratase n=1 Tax=Methanimicrococcus hongohii TaxID=3028295 RepID=A0AA96UZ35_9EURY|nr:oleate hydratase [Methanimicrococcus sp. Hf6]WNY23005.1 Oleate hydratase [Methanimicrococcus sp. Hf6]
MAKEKCDRHAYFIGGGLASLAGAVYLIRDFAFKGENIHILESLDILGGSNDGIGTPKEGFVCRGGRMLNEETYENFWDLFHTIPSLERPGLSVTDEILEFDHAHPTHANARLIDKDGSVLDVMSMGFDNSDRMKLTKLMVEPERNLDNLRIRDWFSPHFFTTNFWYMWQTTFAFQEWSSVCELKRYMNRMIYEFSRIQTLEGVTRTRFNQYDSLIVPLKMYLEDFNVDFNLKCTVTDIDFKNTEDPEEIIVRRIHYVRGNGKAGTKSNDNSKTDSKTENKAESKNGVINLKKKDICIFTCGCITDNSDEGDFKTPARYLPDNPPSADLWRKITAKKPGLGNPEPFFGHPDETKWESFTVTSNGDKLLQMIEKYSRNVPGSGALMTFKDSSWRMSIVVAAQPHFKNQPENQTIFWGYGLYPDRVGDYVKKPMIDCTGEEMLTELLHHLHFEDEADDIMKDVVNVIPSMMPYVDALFQCRAKADRPKVIPKGSRNFAMVGQFVELPKDMVFTEEYSVRTARYAVYKLMGSDKKVLPVTPYNKQPEVLLRALNTMYR